jgi:ADP-ribose pyrophosphatase YjhB (NUDIX family)
MVTKRLSDKEFREIYSKVPRLCVDLLIRNDTGQVLLTLRRKNPANTWHLPGGTVFVDETLQQAAERIAKEELSMEVQVLGFKGHVDAIGTPDLFGRPVSILVEAQLITPAEKIILDEQAYEWRFFDNPPNNTLPSHKLVLQSLQ